MLRDRGLRENRLSGFTEHGLLLLVNERLDKNRRHELLKRLRFPDYPGLVDLIIADLQQPRGSSFGSLSIHHRLVLEQLEECRERRPALLKEQDFVAAMIRRLQPDSDAGVIGENPAAYQPYLERLWSFVGSLPPVHNNIKAHVLYHYLDDDRSRGVYNRDRFMQYLKLPRRVAYMREKYLSRPEFRGVLATLGVNSRVAGGLKRISDDWPLVKDYLAHFFNDGDQYKSYSNFLRDRLLKSLYAETKILVPAGVIRKALSLPYPVT